MGAGTTLARVSETGSLGTALGWVEVLPDRYMTMRRMNQPTSVTALFRNTAAVRSLVTAGRTLAIYTVMHAGTANEFNRDMGAGVVETVSPELLTTGESVIAVTLRGLSSLLGKALRFEPLGKETIFERYVGVPTGTATVTVSAPVGNNSLTLDSLEYAETGHVAWVPLATGVKQRVVVTGTFGSQVVFTPVLTAVANAGAVVEFFDPVDLMIVGPFTKTLLRGAPRNNGGCTLTDIVGIDVGDFISVPMGNGDNHVTRITSLEPYGVQDHVEFDARLPWDSLAGGASVTIYKGTFSVSDSGSLMEGDRIEVEQDDGTWLVTLIRKLRSQVVSLRDFVPTSAGAGRRVRVYDYSEPTFSDVSELMAMRPDFAISIEGGDGTAMGTALIPRGDTLLQMLSTMAERNGEFWQDFPHTGTPLKKLSWRKTADATAGGNAPDGVKLTLPGPGTNLAAIYADDNHGIIYGIKREQQNGLVNRLYAVTADNRINLGYCSEEALAYAGSLGFSVVAVDDLYTPHYLEDASSVAANGVLEAMERVGDISLDDTASAVELMAACDQLLFAAVNALLQYQARVYYTIECQIEWPLYPGYVVHVTNEGGIEPAVDDDFYVIEVTDRLDDTGVPMTSVVVSDTLRARRTPANAMARHNQAILQAARRSTTRVTTSSAGLIRSSGGGVTDHGALTGLGDDDHPQYLLDTVFVAHVADAAAHHDPVSPLNTGVQVTGQAVGVRLAGVSGIEIDNGLRLKGGLAGLGLEMPEGTQQLQVRRYADSGIYADGVGLRLAPGTVSSGTGNTLAGSSHVHAVEAATDARVVVDRGKLLKSDAAGSVGAAQLYAGVVWSGDIRGEAGDLKLTPPAGFDVVAAGALRFAAGFRLKTDAANDLTMAPGGRLIVDPVGDVVQVNSATSLQTAHHAGGYLGSGWRLTYDGELDARFVYADELHVSSLIYDAAQVKVGRLLTAQSAAELAEPFEIPLVGQADWLVVGDAAGLVNVPLFADGDWVVMQVVDRSGGGLQVRQVYGTVDGYVDLPGDQQRWLFRTRSAAVVGQVVGAGTVVHGLGKSGDGWHEINAIDAQGPYATVRVWRGGDPFTPGNVRTVARFGQLSGVTGRREWGLMAGEATSRRAILSNRQTEIHGGRISAYQGDGAQVRLAAVRLEVGVLGRFYVPTGDVSSEAVESTGATMWQVVDESPAGTGDYIQNEPNAVAEAVLKLTNAGGSWSGLAWARVALTGVGVGFVYDAIRLTVQVMSADGSQALTGELALYSWSGNTTLSFDELLPDVDPLATSADWANARLVIRWEPTMASSREAIRLDPAVPSLAVGYPLPTGVAAGGAGFWTGLEGGVWQARIGAAAGAGLRWTGAGLDLLNELGEAVIALPVGDDAYFANPVRLGTAGGVWQAAGGTFGAPVDGLKIWNAGGKGRLGVFSGTGRALTLGSDGLMIPASGAFAPGGISELTFYDVGTGKRVAGLDAQENIEGGGATGYTTAKLYLNGFGNDEVAALSMGYSSAGGAGVTLRSDDELVLSAGDGDDALLRMRRFYDTVALAYADEVVVETDHLRVHSDSNHYVGLELQGDGVNHGMTGLAGSNVYGTTGRNGANGGFKVAGYTGGNVGLYLSGHVTDEETTRSALARAAVVVNGAKRSGAGVTVLGNDANLFAVLNNGVGRVFVTAVGNVFWDGSGAAFDDYVDVNLVRTADLLMAGRLDAAWAGWLGYNGADLEAAGLVSFGEEGRVMVNGTRMQRLLAGAVWELSERLGRLEAGLR